MQNALGVRGGQAGAQLARDLDRLVGRQAADAAQQRAEVFAIHVLHRQVRLAVHFAEIVNAADVGMRDLARDADFIVEARQRGWIARGHFGQELERDLLAQREIVRAIHFAHAAAAEQRDDAVAIGQQRTGQEAAFVQRTGRRREGDCEGGRAGGGRRSAGRRRPQSASPGGAPPLSAEPQDRQNRLESGMSFAQVRQVTRIPLRRDLQSS